MLLRSNSCSENQNDLAAMLLREYRDAGGVPNDRMTNALLVYAAKMGTAEQAYNSVKNLEALGKSPNEELIETVLLKLLESRQPQYSRNITSLWRKVKRERRKGVSKNQISIVPFSPTQYKLPQPHSTFNCLPHGLWAGNLRTAFCHSSPASIPQKLLHEILHHYKRRRNLKGAVRALENSMGPGTGDRIAYSILQQLYFAAGHLEAGQKLRAFADSLSTTNAVQTVKNEVFPKPTIFDEGLKTMEKNKARSKAKRRALKARKQLLLDQEKLHLYKPNLRKFSSSKAIRSST